MRSSAVFVALASLASVAAQSSTYLIEARPPAPGTSQWIQLPSGIVSLGPQVSADPFVFGDGAFYDTIFDALGIPATSGPVQLAKPGAVAGLSNQNFTVDASGTVAFNAGGYQFFSCGVAPSILEVTVPGGSSLGGACTPVTLFLNNVGTSTLPPPPVNSSHIMAQSILGSPLTLPAGNLYLAVDGSGGLFFTTTAPVVFFHDDIAKAIYPQSLRTFTINTGDTTIGQPVTVAVTGGLYQDFSYSAAGAVTFLPRGGGAARNFFACPVGTTLYLYSSTLTFLPSPQTGVCIPITLIAQNTALFVPPISSSSVASSSSAPASSSAVASSSAISSSSQMATTTAATTAATSTETTTTETTTPIPTVTETTTTNTETTTGTETATTTETTSTSMSGTSSLPNPTPTPGAPSFVLVITASSNPALVNLNVVLSGSATAGILILTSSPASSVQFVNGFLRFVQGVFGIIDGSSRNPSGAAVAYSDDDDPFWGFSRIWASGPGSRKRQSLGTLSFTLPDGTPLFFYACQVGGATGNFVLTSSFSNVAPVGCASVTIGAQTPSTTGPTAPAASNSVSITNDICIHAFGVDICTSGVFQTTGSGNVTAVTHTDISIGTTFLVCALNSTDCHPVETLPVTDLPVFSLTCTCPVCCSIMPVNAAASANAAAAAAASSCGCASGSSLASAAASAAAAAAANGSGASAAAAAAAAAAGNGSGASAAAAAAAAAAAGKGSSAAASGAAAAAAGNASASAGAPVAGNAVAPAPGSAAAANPVPGSAAAVPKSNASVFTGAALSTIVDFISTLLVAVGTAVVLA